MSSRLNAQGSDSTIGARRQFGQIDPVPNALKPVAARFACRAVSLTEIRAAGAMMPRIMARRGLDPVRVKIQLSLRKSALQHGGSVSPLSATGPDKVCVR
jgi:hypothetical protein